MPISNMILYLQEIHNIIFHRSYNAEIIEISETVHAEKRD